MPEALTITLANLVYFEKSELPQPLANRLIRLAAFQNPEFYKAQAMRFPVWELSGITAKDYATHLEEKVDSSTTLARRSFERC